MKRGTITRPSSRAATKREPRVASGRSYEAEWRGSRFAAGGVKGSSAFGAFDTAYTSLTNGRMAWSRWRNQANQFECSDLDHTSVSRLLYETNRRTASLTVKCAACAGAGSAKLF